MTTELETVMHSRARLTGHCILSLNENTAALQARIEGKVNVVECGRPTQGTVQK